MATVTSAAGSTLQRRPAAAPAADRIDLRDLSPEWARRQGPLLEEYCRYIHSLRLEHVSVRQMVMAHAKSRGGVWNSLPPKHWWNRMGHTLKVLDRVAKELDQPVQEVLSAYRSPAYNARCPGASRGSWHQANVALDVRFSVRASTVTSLTRRMRDRGLFQGGVGSYSSFTHIDTRGTNANW